MPTVGTSPACLHQDGYRGLQAAVPVYYSNTKNTSAYKILLQFEI